MIFYGRVGFRERGRFIRAGGLPRQGKITPSKGGVFLIRFGRDGRASGRPRLAGAISSHGRYRGMNKSQGMRLKTMAERAERGGEVGKSRRK